MGKIGDPGQQLIMIFPSKPSLTVQGMTLWKLGEKIRWSNFLIHEMCIVPFWEWLYVQIHYYYPSKYGQKLRARSYWRGFAWRWLQIKEDVSQKEIKCMQNAEEIF
jgi:hypothetical protein